MTNQTSANTDPDSIPGILTDGGAAIGYNNTAVTSENRVVPFFLVGGSPVQGMLLSTNDIFGSKNMVISARGTPGARITFNTSVGTQIRANASTTLGEAGVAVALGNPSYTGGTQYYASFLTGSFANFTGSISTPGSTTSYNTSSDYRLKDNITPIENGLEVINSLQPREWTWKNDGQPGVGFIAHEVTENWPSANQVGLVDGEKDAVAKKGKLKYTQGENLGQYKKVYWSDDDGNPQETYDIVDEPNEEKIAEYLQEGLVWEEVVELQTPKYQSVDTSFLIAPLVSAIQQLYGLINSHEERFSQLESRMAALEANS
jgi:hypothetical protein